MPVEFAAKPSRRSLPVHARRKDGLADAGLDAAAVAWAEANGFTGEAGSRALLPGGDGASVAHCSASARATDEFGALAFGALAQALPEGDWHFASKLDDPTLAAIGLKLGGYDFTRYGKKPGRALRFALPKGADARASSVWPKPSS